MEYSDPYNIAVIWLRNNPPSYDSRKETKTRGGVVMHPDYQLIELLVRQYSLSITVHAELENCLIERGIMKQPVTK